MVELDAKQVRIQDEFWSPRLRVNASAAILHQWDQLERTGCIDNFRMVAGQKEGFREGWFFADSDAFKWLDAACRIQSTQPSAELGERIDALLGLLGRAQSPDGYLYTYNQVHFPGQRWVNLQIEHELYCHGHLIEAGISHHLMEEATYGRREGDPSPRAAEARATTPRPGPGLELARKAADLLVRDLAGAGPECTDGHEEVELALIKLYRLTAEPAYLDLAQSLLERRGRIGRFWWLLLRQTRSVRRRREQVNEQRVAYLAAHPQHSAVRLPPDNVSKRTRGGRLRSRLNALSGKALQQHRPLREVTEPVGHAVRFAYLETGAAMLCRERPDAALLAALETAWDRMVRRRMYVTGGVGSLPETEGFGRDYELDPEAAYAETCAALGCLFWNWEMALLTRQARYADLFEWQLYNAASVGMGTGGTAYLYNNPLACRGGVERQPWFGVPCCPSNLSRTWAWLGRYLFSAESSELWVHQYVGCQARLELGAPVEIEIESGLPWRGEVRIRVASESPVALTLHLRIPSWTRGYRVRVNGQPVEPLPLPPDRQSPVATASGYAPHGAFYVPVARTWAPGDCVELELPMPVIVRRPLSRVRGSRGRAALTRGPLVYCLESTDNPGLDLFEMQVDLASLRPDRFLGTLGGEGPGAGAEHPHAISGALQSGGSAEWAHAPFWADLWVLRGRTTDGNELTAIPYYAWANRGPSQMNVLVKV